MSVQFELKAEARQDVGKGASRRLRRAGRVPAVIYGGHQDPLALTLEHDSIIHQLDNEAFYSSVLSINVGGRTEKAVLRDLQRHPYKPAVLHMDFQRVSEDEAIRVHVPLHFLNEEKCKGVRQDGGVLSHQIIEVEVSCLPRDLPEFIEVDVADLGMGETLHLSELRLPEGVTLTAMSSGEEHDTAVVNVHHARVSSSDESEEGEDEQGEA